MKYEKIIRMYLTMLPLIMAGIANMLFVKTSFYKRHRYPIDRNICLKDGKRVFGENKTWTGFISMTIFCVLFQVFWGYLCSSLNIQNDLYRLYSNSFRVNLIFGFFTGLSYMLFELPNSFLKRRFAIPPGKTRFTLSGCFFFLLDQFDSMFGVMFVLYLAAGLSFREYAGYVLLGGITHLGVNTLLYLSKIRRNL